MTSEQTLRVMDWMLKVSGPVKTHTTPPSWLPLSLRTPSLQLVIGLSDHTEHTYLPPITQNTNTPLLSSVVRFTSPREREQTLDGAEHQRAPKAAVQWVKDLSRHGIRAIVTNSPPSDNKVRSLNTTRSYLPASAPPQSLCFVWWAVPVVITLICEDLKSSQGCFVYFLRRSPNILWNVCHQIEML